MPQYAALDVSNEKTAIHVIDETGATVWRGKRASDPDVLTTTLRRHAPDLVRVGLETGPLTPWLYHTCKAEPRRVSRRPQLLRGWSHDEANPTVFP
ncbi:hypothetical protein ADL19_28415 [Streptomyces purpurogeneiscleroticus]|nr:hypothetical protein ADL19_28415 [Streptomyces purpurogeneiscleroticus]